MRATFRYGVLAALLVGAGCNRIPTCTSDEECARWRAQVCGAMDLTGTWNESRDDGATPGALRITTEEPHTDVTVTWARGAPYGGEDAVLSTLLVPPERSLALGTLTLGDDDPREILGDNLAPREGITRLVVQSREFGCRPTPPERFCELRYVLMVEGAVGEATLHGTVEMWRETQTAPFERTITRAAGFPVRFTRDTPLTASTLCVDGGVPGG